MFLLAAATACIILDLLVTNSMRLSEQESDSPVWLEREAHSVVQDTPSPSAKYHLEVGHTEADSPVAMQQQILV